MWKNHHNLILKFKDKSVSEIVYHAHLYVESDKIYLRIILDDTQPYSKEDYKFMSPQIPLGPFEGAFEIIEDSVGMSFENSKIYRVESAEEKDGIYFFTVFINRILLKFTTQRLDLNHIGEVYLNNNGLKLVSYFHTSFNNLRDKNVFSISRMEGMSDYYQCKDFSFCPEFFFSHSKNEDGSEFTIRKIPGLAFKDTSVDYKEVLKKISIVCNFLSFCFGIRIYPKEIKFYKSEDLYVVRDASPNHKTFVSKTLYIPNKFLKKNCRIETLLKTDWFETYLLNEKKISKAIDNYLHSREVNLGAAFLLLYNVLEIFNVNQDKPKFDFSKDKEDLFKQAYLIVEKALKNPEDKTEFSKKWSSVENMLNFKPFKSPFEETLNANNIDIKRMPYSFSKLKKTRDKIAHGSVNSISDRELELRVFCMRRIATMLILSNLGLKEDFNDKLIYR